MLLTLDFEFRLFCILIVKRRNFHVSQRKFVCILISTCFSRWSWSSYYCKNWRHTSRTKQFNRKAWGASASTESVQKSERANKRVLEFRMFTVNVFPCNVFFHDLKWIWVSIDVLKCHVSSVAESALLNEMFAIKFLWHV